MREEEVIDRAARIARTLDVRSQPAHLAERLAIEQTLVYRGYLQQEIGGWCEVLTALQNRSNSWLVTCEDF